MLKYVLALALLGAGLPVMAQTATQAATRPAKKDAVMKDVVTMANGDKITGSIVEVNPTSVIVKTPYAGTLTIERSAVKTLQSESRVRVVRDTGVETEVYLAPVATGKGWREVEVPVPVETVTPAVAKRATSYLYLGPDWQNQLAIGVTSNSGNDDTQAYNGALSFHYLKKPQELTLKFEALYGRSHGAQTQGLLDENLVYRKDITNQWYWYADDDARYDAIKGLSAQAAASVGLGYYLVKTDKLKVDVHAGPAVTYERTFAGHTDVAPAAEGGLRIDYTINDRVTAHHETTYDTSVINFDDWRLHSETALNFKIDVERGLGLKLAFADDYDNEVTVGTKRNDTRLTLALTLDF